MTWVAVVKFWAYQAHQLQLIVYTNLTLMLHGLELFSSGIRQWGAMTEETSTSFNVNLNVTMNVICAIPYDISSNPSSICYLCWMNEKTTTMTLAFCASTVPYGFGWIAIGH